MWIRRPWKGKKMKAEQRNLKNLKSQKKRVTTRGRRMVKTNNVNTNEKKNPASRGSLRQMSRTKMKFIVRRESNLSTSEILYSLYFITN